MTIGAAKPVVIIYGNCQAEHIARIAHARMAAAGRWRFVYIHSYLHPERGPGNASDDDLRNCAALWCQHDETNPFPWIDRVPRRARVLRFPGFDFNLLWPLNVAGPDNRPDPPRYPWGRCPYGDWIARKVRKEGLRGSTALERYHELSAPALANLARLQEIERIRIMRREKACDIQVWPVIEQLFVRERLFWTVNHPSNLFLYGTANTLLERTFHTSLDITEAVEELFAADQVPIHPLVGRFFGLQWWREDLVYSWKGRRFTHDEYISNYIDDPDA